VLWLSGFASTTELTNWQWHSGATRVIANSGQSWPRYRLRAQYCERDRRRGVHDPRVGR